MQLAHRPGFSGLKQESALDHAGQVQAGPGAQMAGNTTVTCVSRFWIPHPLMAKLCALVTPWLCNAQTQQTCGILLQMET